ncbi:MAG: fibronectin type III domain-containing protein [Patescibacteria group bacterium]
MRKFLVLFVATVLFCLSSYSVLAADLVVSCPDEGPNCTLNPGGALFSESNWYPGAEVGKEIVVENNDADDDCLLWVGGVLNESESSGGLESQLDNQVQILEEATTKDFSMSDFLDGDQFLTTVPASGVRSLIWTIEMDTQAGNQYQGVKTVFDINYHFECGQEPVATTNDGGGTDDGGGDGGGGGGTACTQTAPGAVSGLTAVGGGLGQVVLSWSPPSSGSVTHYLIAYGTSPGNYVYGNPNVGNVFSYTVSGLSSGVNYYFAVKAVNDCAPGPYSNEASVIAGGVLGQQVLESPAEGFGVLGETTEPGQIGGGGSTGSGEVAGTSTGNCRWTCFWWLVLPLLALAFNLVYLKSFREKLGQEKWRFLFIPAISFLAYLLDDFFHVWWCPTVFCHWMWLWASLSTVLPLVVWYRRWKKPAIGV